MSANTIFHYPWRRKRSYIGLDLQPATITDTTPLSHQYFGISDIPTMLTAGKNMIKIGGTNNLHLYSEIRIEVLDQLRKPIYWEIDDWTDFASQRVITIWIYQETLPGPAAITLLGKTSSGQSVKWQTIINADPNTPNSTPILFSQKPTILVDEVFRVMEKPLWPNDKIVSQSVGTPFQPPAGGVGNTNSDVRLSYNYSGKPGFENYTGSIAENLETSKKASKLYDNNEPNKTIWTTWNQNAITTEKGYKGYTGFVEEIPSFTNTIFKQDKTKISTQQGVTLKLNNSDIRYPDAISESGSIGDTEWSSPNKAKGTPDGVFTQTSLYIAAGAQRSKDLFASDYSFNIPSDCTIKGIELYVMRRAKTVTSPGSIQDLSIYLSKDVSSFSSHDIGDNKALTGTAATWSAEWTGYSLTDANCPLVYGGPNDLWGQTWTPAEINSADFGAQIKVNMDGHTLPLPSDIPHPIIDSIGVNVYAIDSMGQPIHIQNEDLFYFKKEHEGGTLIAKAPSGSILPSGSAQPFTTKITKVLNGNTIKVQDKYLNDVGNDIFSFQCAGFELTHSAPPTSYTQTQAYENFAAFKIHNLEPMTGDIFRLRVSARQHDSTNNEFEVIANKVLEGGNILIDKNIPPYTTPIGEFVTQPVVDTYWEAKSYADLNPSHESSSIPPLWITDAQASCSWDNGRISEGIKISNEAGAPLTYGVFKVQPKYTIQVAPTTASALFTFNASAGIDGGSCQLTSSLGAPYAIKMQLTHSGAFIGGGIRGSDADGRPMYIYSDSSFTSVTSTHFSALQGNPSPPPLHGFPESDYPLSFSTPVFNLMSASLIPLGSPTQVLVHQTIPGSAGNTPITYTDFTGVLDVAPSAFTGGSDGISAYTLNFSAFANCNYAIGVDSIYGSQGADYPAKMHIAISGSAIDNSVVNQDQQYLYDSLDFKGRILETFILDDITGKTGAYSYRLDNLEFVFEADKSGSVTPVIIVESGLWEFNEITMGGREETGFNPNYVELEVPIAPKFDGSSVDFKFEYFDYLGNASKDTTYINNVYFSNGKATFVQGKFNLVTGSLFVGDVIGKGIEQSGENSGFVRSVGYDGWGEATSSMGDPGFILFSGSVGLGAASNDYKGVGIEMAAGPNAYFKFRTDPSVLEIRSENVFFSGSNVEINTPNFFLGTEGGSYISGSPAGILMTGSSLELFTENFFLGTDDGTYISGSNGNIAISASNFSVSSEGEVTASDMLLSGVAHADFFAAKQIVIDNDNSGSFFKYFVQGTQYLEGSAPYCVLDFSGVDGPFGDGDAAMYVRFLANPKAPIVSMISPTTLGYDGHILIETYGPAYSGGGTCGDGLFNEQVYFYVNYTSEGGMLMPSEDINGENLFGSNLSTFASTSLNLGGPPPTGSEPANWYVAAASCSGILTDWDGPPDSSYFYRDPAIIALVDQPPGTTGLTTQGRVNTARSRFTTESGDWAFKSWYDYPDNPVSGGPVSGSSCNQYPAQILNAAAGGRYLFAPGDLGWRLQSTTNYGGSVNLVLSKGGPEPGGLILQSPNGSYYLISVDNTGHLNSSSVFW